MEERRISKPTKLHLRKEVEDLMSRVGKVVSEVGTPGNRYDPRLCESVAWSIYYGNKYCIGQTGSNSWTITKIFSRQEIGTKMSDPFLVEHFDWSNGWRWSGSWAVYENGKFNGAEIPQSFSEWFDSI